MLPTGNPAFPRYVMHEGEAIRVVDDPAKAAEFVQKLAEDIRKKNHPNHFEVVFKATMQAIYGPLNW